MEEQKISEKLEEEYKEECEIMLKTKLFEDSLCTKFYQQRLEALEKARNEPNYSAFVKILIHEIKIVNLIESNKSKRKIGEINNRIIARVKHFYKVLKTFQDLDYDYRVNEEYYQFCLLCNKPAALAVLEFMMGNFSNQPKLYSLAANWAHMMNDIGKAFFVLREGMKLFPKDHQLYVTAFNLHLNQVKSVFKEKPPTHQKFGNNVWDQTVKDHVDLVLANITEFEHFQDILRTIAPFDFAYKAYNQLLSYLFTHYSTKAKFWHLCALREKQGYHFSTSDDDTNTDHFETRTKYQILNCVAKYKQGLKLVTTIEDQRHELWSYYLNYLLEILVKNFHAGNDTKRKVCRDGLEQAECEDMLEESHYEKIAVSMDDDIIDKFLIVGTKKFPKNTKIWKAYIQDRIRKKDEAEVNEIFQKAIKALGDQALPIWQLMYRHYMTSSNIEDKIQFFEESIKQEPSVSNLMKSYYLDWYSMEYGIEPTRQFFNKMSQDGQLPKEVLQKMIFLENCNPIYDSMFLNNAIKMALEQYPDEPEFWKNILEFYYKEALQEQDFNKYQPLIVQYHKDALEKLHYEKHQVFNKEIFHIMKNFTS